MRKNSMAFVCLIFCLFPMAAQSAGGGKGEKKTILIPMMSTDGRLDVQFSGAKMGANMPPAPAGKCWKWVDPCPPDKKAAKVDPKSSIWAVHQANPETNKGAVNTIWIVGPVGGKVEVDKKEKEAWRAILSQPKEVKFAGVTKSVWSIRLEIPEKILAQVIPEPPPMQRGCWVLVSCDQKRE